jgi:predicted alpha/beta-hydrolase family hydrolase
MTSTPSPEPLSVDVPGSGPVSALCMTPSAARAGYVFAHGAGAGMDHPFMSALCDELAQRQVATLRFQFPFMQQGRKRPDTPAVAQAAVRAAVAEAQRRWPTLPLFAGGKSFGGRMASQAQAASPVAGVRGLVFVGFPLHLAGKPGVVRAAHLAHVQVPMLFLQGTRDALADRALLREVLAPLKDRATLALEDDADHAFHVRVRSGRSDVEVLASLAGTMAAWMSAQR